jgi:molybdopterin synthase catalytic subunit
VSDRVLVSVTGDALSAEAALAFVADAAAGGTCLFIGTVRDHSDAGAVTGLTYEAWPELAEQRLRELADEIVAGWPVRKVALMHRTGDLAVGEASVLVAVSSPHRAEAFDAARHGIERLKADAPIWKKESLDSGQAHWVAGS